ncbi:site-2 protease family protein [Serinibacter arcticus]|uniref:Zinc metalloprotease n=1 Tax=Serinibacter arcticus TaxID=1655435 RepID=A0A4Z1DY75_9MICO|nr:site-2 protease family protein [Serinibacter arcticus]TGO04506.1 Zn-dependent protease [Serinibacter arcticus]
MKRPGWRIGVVGGSPVYLAPSWLLIAAVLTLLFLPTVQRAAPRLDTPAAVAAAATFPILLFASVLAHELAHGAAARAVGARVREYVITFWGGHTSFGEELRTPGASAIVSAAGPLANVVLAVAGWFVLGAMPPGLPAVIVAALTYANAVVAAFNLLPGNPLDGGRILEALIWKVTGNRETGTIGSGWVGRGLAVVLAAVILGLPLLRGERPTLTTGIWGLLVAGLVWTGASQSIKIGRARRSAAGFDLRALLRPAVVVDARASLAQVPRPPFGMGSSDVVAIDAAGTPVAVLDAAALAQVPPDAYASTPVTAVARSLPPSAVLTAVTGPDALGALARGINESPVVVVVGPGGILGTTTRESVVAALASPGR